jgi:hypothetical protein
LRASGSCLPSASFISGIMEIMCRIADGKASEPKSSAPLIALIAPTTEPGPEQDGAPRSARLVNEVENLSRATRLAEYRAAERGRSVHRAAFGLPAPALGGLRRPPQASLPRYPCPGRGPAR